MNTRDVLLKMALDSQERIRDLETFSKQVDDNEVKEAFQSLPSRRDCSQGGYGSCWTNMKTI